MVELGIPLAEPGKLADRLGMRSRSAPKTVSRWRDGPNDPSYDWTMRMLATAGFLNVEKLEGALRRAGLAEAVEAGRDTDPEPPEPEAGRRDIEAHSRHAEENG